MIRDPEGGMTRIEAQRDADLDRLHEELDALLEECGRALRGYFAGQMAGRNPSGFVKGIGYHEASYLYGKAAGVAELGGVMVDPYPKLVALAKAAARDQFVADVLEAGAGVFTHPDAGEHA